MVKQQGTGARGDVFIKSPLFLLHEKFASQHNCRAGRNTRISSMLSQATVLILDQVQSQCQSMNPNRMCRW